MNGTDLATRVAGGRQATQSTEARLAATPRHLTNLTIPELLSLSKVLVGTGFLPAAIKTPEQAAAIMLKGQELAVPPMAALSSISVINGKPVAGAELMAALIYRDHGDDALMVTRTDAEACTVSYRRRGWRERRSFTFSAADARDAGLLEKTTWKQYRPAMLRARAFSAVARLAFPDTIGGMYTPEELGAAVEVDPDTGEIGCIVDSAPSPVARAAVRQPVAVSAPTLATDVQHNAAVLAAAGNVADPWRAELIERYHAAWDQIQAVSGRPPRAPREVDASTTTDALQEQVDAGERWLATHQLAKRADDLITAPATDDAPLTESEASQ